MSLALMRSWVQFMLMHVILFLYLISVQVRQLEVETPYGLHVNSIKLQKLQMDSIWTPVSSRWSSPPGIRIDVFRWTPDGVHLESTGVSAPTWSPCGVCRRR
ncbi:hypothetical protein GALMADRAFT_606497 [Galerina marginata CBS 339.88]|uniref:Uncharacterized protein n=1 Tax=Galerina marginata (strain CBS 339.88) TaxID=685588 RepID=A0A067T2J7_GALM3|nr:hypothetical protein GALMADRAFT_606497 [Galerina marginata CBS 339.88]